MNCHRIVRGTRQALAAENRAVERVFHAGHSRGKIKPSAIVGRVRIGLANARIGVRKGFRRGDGRRLIFEKDQQVGQRLVKPHDVGSSRHGIRGEGMGLRQLPFLDQAADFRE